MPEKAMVTDFSSVEALREGYAAKEQFQHVDLYHRDGSSLLGEVEARIAGLAGVNPDALLSYNTGMSAVTDAIDVGLHVSDREKPIVACSVDAYTQSRCYIENFVRGRRADVFYFDSGDNDEVDRVLTDRRPDVVVAETVANYVNVPVLDTANLLNRVREVENKPVVILDNTLPLSTGLPLGEMLGEDDPVIVVESGTKSYTFNRELLGIGYTHNQELHDWLRRYRRTRGSLPGPEHLERIDELLPADQESFDVRNRKLFRSTAAIAIMLSIHNGESSGYVISHPILPGHDNHELYAQVYPEGGTPVLYIQSGMQDQFETTARLWDSSKVREQAKLGQSFGFDHTRIVADEHVPAIRVAGGSETDGEALGEALAEALYAG